MSPIIRANGWILSAVTIACVLFPAAAWPCAGAPPRSERPFGAKGEDAVIIWDEERHVEHFVRNAVFDTKVSSFGFLVPVPARPTLAEASDGVFDELELATPPCERWERQWIWRSPPFGCGTLTLLGFDEDRVGAGAPDSRRGVTVLEEKRVAGFDATVLAASDTPALSDWLAVHGFDLRDALRRWLAVYVAKKWNVVAFRYQRPEGVDALERPGSFPSRAVRISFPTDEPVYPYREPDDVPIAENRSLRLFVVAEHPVDGMLIDDGGRSWDAERPVAMQADLRHVGNALPGLEQLMVHSGRFSWWVSEFGDRTTKRPASDLVFRRSRSSDTVCRVWYRLERPSLFIPYEVLLPAGSIVWWWRWRRNKRRGGVVAT